MSVNLSLFAGAGWQFFDNNGVPLAGGLIYTYAAGTTTPQATYTSSTGTIAQSNPIVLNSAGRVSVGEVWVSEGITYKFVLKDSAGTTIGTYDNINSTYVAADLANTTNPTLGDALVGFRQSNLAGNLTGSIGSTVHQKLQSYISILDFIPLAEIAAIQAGTSTYDCSTALSNALAACTSQVITSSFYAGCNSIFFPKGRYRFASTINLKQTVRLYGEAQDVSTILQFDNGIDGIIVNYYNTYGRTTTSTLYSAGLSTIENMFLYSMPGSSVTGRGISCRVRANLYNLEIANFPEDGVHCVATSGGSAATEGNCNLMYISRVNVSECGGNGFLFDGADANAGTIIQCSARYNAGKGFYDSSFLGNTFIGCHTENNTGQAYCTDDTNACSMFLGCYSEGGQPASSFASNTMVLGGLHGAGVTAADNLMIRGHSGQGFLGFYPSDTESQASNVNIQFGNRSSGEAGYLLNFFNSLYDFSTGQGIRYFPVNSAYMYLNAVRAILAFTMSDATPTQAAGDMTGGRGSFQGSQLFLNGFFLGASNGWSGGERFIQYGSAAPTTGTHALGEIVFNNAATAGGYVGWVCTTAGTPGTWKTFGAISA